MKLIAVFAACIALMYLLQAGYALNVGDPDHMPIHGYIGLAIFTACLACLSWLSVAIGYFWGSNTPE